MWLHRYEVVPASIVALFCYLVAGWSGLIVGFFWSTVLIFHAVFCINSLAHVHGKARYVTGDDSRNNWLLAFFTMGEGWHNNHHAYQSSVRQGFKWWEIDATYYILKGLAALGMIWDLKLPPQSVLRNEHRLGSRVINRAAQRLAERFHREQSAPVISPSLDNQVAPAPSELMFDHGCKPESAATSRPRQIPSRDVFMQEARSMFGNTRSLDDIVDRAHHLLMASLPMQLASVNDR
jgi:stearoyl-CoA desaturase (delta-9 desaturase)